MDKKTEIDLTDSYGWGTYRPDDVPKALKTIGEYIRADQRTSKAWQEWLHFALILAAVFGWLIVIFIAFGGAA